MSETPRKARMGRPPKPEGERKTGLNVSLTPQQRTRLLAEAEARQTTASQILRQALEEWWARTEATTGGAS